MFPTRPFAPVGPTQTMSLTTTTINAAIPGSANWATHGMVRIYNACSLDAFITFANSSNGVSTVGSGMPIPGYGVELFDIAGYTHVAGITGSGSGFLYLTRGAGL